VSDRRLRTLAALIAAFVGLYLFWGALFRGETFAHRDLGAFYRPAKAILVPLARASGGVPQWNPLFASGQPFAANPEHEIYHPMTALLFLLPFEWAFRLQVMLPPLFAAATMFALLRTLRRSRAAALFGAVGWGFGGYLLSTSNLLPILFAIAALPLVILFAVRLSRGARPMDVAGLAVSFGAMCLAGEPSSLLMTPPLVVAAVLSSRATRARGGLVGAGVVLGAALGAAALLPGLHHAGKTRRAPGLAAEVVDQWSMPPLRVAELFTPNLLGHVDERNAGRYWGRALYPRREFPYLYSLYPGLYASLLAIFAFWVRRRALAPWLAVAGAGLLVAVGNHLPVWGLLRHLPLLSSIRFPEKFALLIAFPVVIASAYGFDQVVHGPRRARRLLARVLLGFGAAAIIAAIFAGRGTPVAVRLAIVALAGAAIFRLSPRRTWGAVIVCAAAALDLGLAGKELVPSVPLAGVARPPTFLAPLTDGRDHTLFHLAAWDPKLNEAPGLAKPPLPAQWGLALTLEQDFDLTQLAWTLRGTELFWNAIERDVALMDPLLRRRGVTEILRFRRGVSRVGGRLVVPRGGSALELLGTGQTQPLAFAATRVERVNGERGWVEAVARLRDDAVSAAVIDEHALDFAGLPSPADVHIGARTPMSTELEVMARGPGPSFIAVNQTWDEGWHLTVDGAPAPLLRTDVSLSGFVLPPGQHHAELTYNDGWLVAGQVVSLLAAIGCLVLVLAGRRADRPDRRRA
jgi:hypothetical protein